MSNVTKNKKKAIKRGVTGFTIIELLVVMAIIGLLASIIMFQVSSVRPKSRDVKREKEVKTLQDSLAIYVVNNKIYPVYAGPITGTDVVSQALLSADAARAIPFDPLNNGNYRYMYDSTDGTTYTITYYLETDSITHKTAGQQTAGP